MNTALALARDSREEEAIDRSLPSSRPTRARPRLYLAACRKHDGTVVTYDQNGNQTIKTKNGAGQGCPNAAGAGCAGVAVTTTFVYDVRDQLISVQENTTTLGQFFYDYAGLRIAKSGADGFIKYVYDGKSVLVQTNSQGTTLAKYDYGPDRLLSINHTTEGRQFYLFDALRSTVNLVKTDGSISARYQYDAWGHLLNSVSSWNKFTYTGHEQDKETGLYYFKARFYDPDTGRFLTQDPYLGDINTPPSLHRYLYAYANPVVWVDLTGYISELTAGMAQFDEWNKNVEASLSALPEGVSGDVTAVAAGVGMGANRVGKGILSGINYVANWGSVLFKTENAQSNAMEILATHEGITSGVTSFVTDRDTRAAIGERIVENFQAVASGDRRAMAELAAFSTQVGLGSISPKGVPPVGARVAAGIEEVKTLVTEVKSVITGEGATGGIRQAVKEVTQSVKAEAQSLPERSMNPATQRGYIDVESKVTSSGLRTSTAVTPERAQEFLTKNRLSPERAAGFVESFDGPITARLVRPGEEFGRFTGNPESRGSFLTKSTFGSPSEAVDALNLKPFGNPATYRQPVLSSGRSIVLEGVIKDGALLGTRQTLIINRDAFEFGIGVPLK